MIEVQNLTLTYPSGKGVFDLDFIVRQGEVMGYLGPNGAGKTTTIRALLGFMTPDQGSCSISGLQCSKKAPAIQRNLGYIPGEMTFLDNMNGDEFLRFMAEMRGTRNSALQKRLLDRFELSPKGPIRKYSKGMKQKLGIVTAWMHDPEVLILDEPTSGLDPLMQNRFVELVLEEKRREKTILMSSHRFEEVEKTCDNVLIIKDGRIAAQSDVVTLKQSQRKGFLLKAEDLQGAAAVLEEAGFVIEQGTREILKVYITGEDVDRFVKTIAKCTLLDFDGIPQTLEDIFIQFYGQEVTS